MKELLMIAVGAAMVNNVVLSQFLGLCPFLGVSKKMDTAAGMGGAVIFVLTLSSFCTSLIYNYVLVKDRNGIFADDCIYSGDCSAGSAGGDVLEKSSASPV